MLTHVQVLERLLTRLEKRMESLQRVKLDGYQMVISELENEMDYLAPCEALFGGVSRLPRQLENQCDLNQPRSMSPNTNNPNRATKDVMQKKNNPKMNAMEEWWPVSKSHPNQALAIQKRARLK
jgi:hypothetical protein